MKMVEEMEKLQQENDGSIILVKNGIFFVAIGKDALTLHEKLGLKLTCMKPELCKVGFLVKNVEQYIEKLEKIGYSFILYVKMTKIIQKKYIDTKEKMQKKKITVQVAQNVRIEKKQKKIYQKE